MALALSVPTAFAASAATEEYYATSAVGSGSDHSLWIMGGFGDLGSDFDFDPAGLFTIDDTDAGTLTGRAVSQTSGYSGTGFDVSFTYGTAPFTPAFKPENGSAPGADIRYTFLTGGTLTGFGDLLGLTLAVLAKPLTGPEAAQWGSSMDGSTTGPNNKNANFGMAHWFMVDSIDNACTTSFCATYSGDIADLLGRQGDINVDLTPVPLPAGLPLLAAGIAGFAVLRRRKAA
ncbi:MAG: VPLPA-CTERM sorting domain-containing protein [Pseudomonadota bacterium]